MVFPSGLSLNRDVTYWDGRAKRFEDILRRELERCKKETCDDDYVDMIKSFLAEITNVNPSEHVAGIVELIVKKLNGEEDYVEVAEIRWGTRICSKYVRAVPYELLDVRLVDKLISNKYFNKKIHYKADGLFVEPLYTWQDVFVAEGTLTNFIGEVYSLKYHNVYGASFYRLTEAERRQRKEKKEEKEEKIRQLQEILKELPLREPPAPEPPPAPEEPPPFPEELEEQPPEIEEEFQQERLEPVPEEPEVKQEQQPELQQPPAPEQHVPEVQLPELGQKQPEGQEEQKKRPSREKRKRIQVEGARSLEEFM